MASIQRCDQCGQFDDHPKVHAGDGFGDGGVRTTHLDCLSADQEQALRDNPHFGELHGAAIDAARSGTHGADLRAHIVANVLPAQAEIIAGHDQAATTSATASTATEA